MDDDFNTADAISVLFDLTKDINNNVNITKVGIEFMIS